MPNRDKVKAALQYKNWYSKNKDKRKVENREWFIKRTYGITRDDYIKILLEQKGVCAICEQPEITIDKRTGNIKELSIDHCHTTGKVRGLLCNHCNHGIGKFKDNTQLLQKAIQYLNDFS